MKRTKVTVEKETKKAYLIKDESGRRGWVHGSLLGEEVAAAARREPADSPSGRVQAPESDSRNAGVFPADVVAALSSVTSQKAETEVSAAMHPENGQGMDGDGGAQGLGGGSGGTRKPMVVYRRFGRDPFVPYSREEDSGLPSVENLELVGILYDESERVALLESREEGGKAFALREHDPVRHGRVLKIQREKVVFLLDEDGIAHSFSLDLVKDRKLRAK